MIVDLSSEDIFQYVVGDTTFHPLETKVDPTVHEIMPEFIYNHKSKKQLTQNEDYVKFCGFLEGLKQNAPKMHRREIKSICEELVDFSPLTLKL